MMMPVEYMDGKIETSAVDYSNSFSQLLKVFDEDMTCLPCFGSMISNLIYTHLSGLHILKNIVYYNYYHY